MKEVKVRTRYDFRAFKYCNWYMLKYNKKVYLVYAILCVLAVGAAVGMFIMQPGQYIFPILFLLLGVYSIYQMLTLEKKLDANIARHFSNHETFDQVIEFTDEKIVIYPDKGEDVYDYDWAYVSEINRINEYYFLKVGQSFVMVDRREEALVEGTSADLDAIMDEKGTTKPYKKFDGVVVKKPITFEHTYVAPVGTAEATVVEEDANQIEEVSSEVEDLEVKNEAIENIEVETEEVEEADVTEDTEKPTDKVE